MSLLILVVAGVLTIPAMIFVLWLVFFILDSLQGSWTTYRVIGVLTMPPRDIPVLEDGDIRIRRLQKGKMVVTHRQGDVVNMYTLQRRSDES